MFILPFIPNKMSNGNVRYRTINLSLYTFNTLQYDYKITYVSKLDSSGTVTTTFVADTLSRPDIQPVLNGSINGTPVNNTGIRIQTLDKKGKFIDESNILVTNDMKILSIGTDANKSTGIWIYSGERGFNLKLFGGLSQNYSVVYENKQRQIQSYVTNRFEVDIKPRIFTLITITTKGKDNKEQVFNMARGCGSQVTAVGAILDSNGNVTGYEFFNINGAVTFDNQGSSS